MGAQVAEAKARKKRRVATKVEQARGKSEKIVDNPDLSAQGKAREVNKLYAKAKAAGAGRKGGKPDVRHLHLVKPYGPYAVFALSVLSQSLVHGAAHTVSLKVRLQVAIARCLVRCMLHSALCCHAHPH